MVNKKVNSLVNQKKTPPKDFYVKLLDTDFAQLHEWMRHYDARFISIISYLHGGYVSIAVAVYVLAYKFEDKFYGSVGATMLLLFASLAGPVFLFSLIKNRIEFTLVSRYVNEMRAAYLKRKPLGIVNQAGIYTGPSYPHYFNPISVHSLFMYFICLCNSIMIAATLCFALRTVYFSSHEEFSLPLLKAIIAAFVTLLLQVVFIIKHLRSKEIIVPYEESRPR